MCGIAGCWERSGRGVGEEVVERMLAPIEHRGPDGRGVVCRDDLALGAVRLSILDLTDAGNQPFVDQATSNVLAYNGELYNWHELGEELRRQGASFVSRCDTEVVLKAFLHWGVDAAVERFRGMFAFAYFDRRARTLWLGRDRLGIKPLYFSELDSGAVVFGSEIKAILAHGGVSAEPSVSAAIAYVLRDYVEGEQTFFRRIRALPPGCVCRVDETSATTRRYFDVVDDLDLDRLRTDRRSADRAAADVNSVLLDSTRRHLASEAPVSALCSGGLDSSLLTAMSAGLRPELTAYVADVSDAKPEARRAERVADLLGVPLHRVPVSYQDFLRTWPWAVWHSDQPLVFSSDPALLSVCRRCREDGVKVVLTGEGADEVFCGYPWVTRAFHEWQRFGRRERVRLGFASRRESRAASAAQLWESTFANYPPAEAERALRDRAALAGGTPGERQARLQEKLSSVLPLRERGLLAASLNSMYGHLAALLHRADRMGMAASVECRVPYLDDVVVEHGLHLPLRYRYHRGTGKWILKHVARRWLPSDVVFAPKWGFATSRSTYAFAGPLLEDGFAADILEWPRHLRPAMIAAAVSAPKPFVLYSLANLELWGRIFVLGQDPGALEALLAGNLDAGRRTTVAAVAG
jgi:asparagine synthase (glutamine-hydrolysing)